MFPETNARSENLTAEILRNYCSFYKIQVSAEVDRD